MTRKIQVESLSMTEQFRREKRLVRARGELALIEDDRSFQYFGYFSLKKANGFYRGNLYKVKKEERF